MTQDTTIDKELAALTEERYVLSFAPSTPRLERRIRELSERIWELQGSVKS